MRTKTAAYWIWSIILLTKGISASHHLNSRCSMNKSCIDRATFPRCRIHRNETYDKIWVILSNLRSSCCVFSSCEVTSRTHFSQQQETSTTRQPLKFRREIVTNLKSISLRKAKLIKKIYTQLFQWIVKFPLKSSHMSGICSKFIEMDKY